MSVRVNLLPQATKDRDRASRQLAALAFSFVVLLAVLGLLFWWASNQVTTARTELASEEAATAELRTEVSALNEFGALLEQQERANTLLSEALSNEVSLASVLQDLAIVMPSDSQLETYAVSIDEADAVNRSVGTFTLTGRTLTSHAPGVERFLLELEKAAVFRDAFLNTSTLDDPEEQTATFSVDGRLGDEAATRRYVDGLPEELR